MLPVTPNLGLARGLHCPLQLIVKKKHAAAFGRSFEVGVGSHGRVPLNGRNVDLGEVECVSIATWQDVNERRLDRADAGYLRSHS